MIPVLTSLAGTCLTSQNWQDVGINTAAFYLDELLMKPGFDLLNTLPDLSSYVAWSSYLVLNATLPKINSEGIYKINSHYDGRVISLSEDDLIKLIAILKPNMVILPSGISQEKLNLYSELFGAVDNSSYKSRLPATGSQDPDVLLNTQDYYREKDRNGSREQIAGSRILNCQKTIKNISIFLPAKDLLDTTNKSYGVYLTYDEKKSFQDLLQEIEQHKHLPCYVSGNLNLELMQELKCKNVQYIESNLIAADGYKGKVYSSQKDLEISDPVYAFEFEPIDKNCECPTCSQKLTKAYLHHLLANTPLLCQRFLIEHNIYFCQKNLR